MDAAKEVPWNVNNAVMLLCALGQEDTAFEITEGYLLWRGRAVSAGRAEGKFVNDYSRRVTPWLFTPPVVVMRADPRFLRLCEDFGLASYWRARGVKPDYQLS
jgi:hypothetical protein